MWNIRIYGDSHCMKLYECSNMKETEVIAYLHLEHGLLFNNYELYFSEE